MLRRLAMRGRTHAVESVVRRPESRLSGGLRSPRRKRLQELAVLDTFKPLPPEGIHLTLRSFEGQYLSPATRRVPETTMIILWSLAPKGRLVLPRTCGQEEHKI